MKIEDPNILSALKKLSTGVLEDARIDKAEALTLREFAAPFAGKSAEMAEFVKLLDQVLEDGVITPDESVRVGAFLAWLTQADELVDEKPTLLNRLFHLGRNRTTVKTEVVAGITTFMTMAYILAVNPSIFSALPGMPNGSVFTATALAAIIVQIYTRHQKKQIQYIAG